MMKTILITGAAGEIGHGLISQLVMDPDAEIVAIDLHAPEAPPCSAKVRWLAGSILDPALLQVVTADYTFDTIFHLAGILSTGGEKRPRLAHEVNVDGSLNILELAKAHSERRLSPVRFVFPSTIAVYGIPSLAEKRRAGKVREEWYLQPLTMYGMNKLYVEHLGCYFSEHYMSLDHRLQNVKIDFRSVRLPGVLSAETVPTGGTSDFGPEMLHAAAQGKPYACFVREDAKIPFLAMPDAVRALLSLQSAPADRLSQRVYNIGSFSVTAAELEARVRAAFPEAELRYEVQRDRQDIVDSWPEDVDDSRARWDWGWAPEFDAARAFQEYLVPGVVRRYRAG